MRRFLAISLLILFGLPFALPLFAANVAEANLPVCCRRQGKHHCSMREIATLNGQHGPMLGSVSEKCPHSVAPVTMAVVPSYTPQEPASMFAGTAQHPAVVAQVEARFRISFDRARQKRGPPSDVS